MSKIDDMKDKAVAAAEAKATQNPPKKAKEKEVAPVAEAAQNSSKKNPAAPTGNNYTSIRNIPDASV